LVSAKDKVTHCIQQTHFTTFLRNNLSEQAPEQSAILDTHMAPTHEVLLTVPPHSNPVLKSASKQYYNNNTLKVIT